jgi:co-chaperonin GroES (HSP10)
MLFVMKDKVLVKLHGSDERSKSGLIIIPKEARQDSFLATVHAVGPQQQQVKPGDVVVISNVAGIEVPWKGEKYIILDDYELMAIYETPEFEMWHGDEQHRFILLHTVEYYECVCGETHRKVVTHGDK